MVKTISKNNAKVADALANYTINVIEEDMLLMAVMKSGILQARNQPPAYLPKFVTS